MPPFFDPRGEREVVAAYKTGASSTTIARRHGCHTQTVLNVLARHGVRARGGDERHSRRRWSDADLADMASMWQDGESRTAIGRKYRAGIETVTRVLTVTLGFQVGEPRHKGMDRHPNWKGGVVTPQGYRLVRVDCGHPFAAMAGKDGYVPEHRLVAATMIGRSLRPDETVHHIDGNRANNAPGNLQVRNGRHGYGQVLRCHSCGSHDIEAVELAGVGGYVGESTRREVAYATRDGKPLRWLEGPASPAEPA